MPLRLVARLVAPVPADRPASALEVLDELGAFGEREVEARAALETTELFGREAELARFVELLAALRERTLGLRARSGSLAGPGGPGGRASCRS